jgi:hypothetical protein
MYCQAYNGVHIFADIDRKDYLVSELCQCSDISRGKQCFANCVRFQAAVKCWRVAYRFGSGKDRNGKC